MQARQGEPPQALQNGNAMAHSPNSHYYHGGGGGQNTANSASGAAQTLQQGQIMLRQLQLMEQQTSKKLRDFEALAALPPELQTVAAQRLQINQGMLQPGMIQGHINQLRQVIEQYKMQIQQVQVQQQTLSRQLQAQHMQQQQQQQQQMPHGSLQAQHARMYNNAQAQAHAQAQAQQQAHAQAQHARAQAQAQQQAQQRAMMQQHSAYQRSGQMHVHQSINQALCAAQPQRLGGLNQHPGMVNPQYMAARPQQQYHAAEQKPPPPRSSRKRTKRDSSPESPPSSPGGNTTMQKTRGSLRSKSKINYAEAEAFGEITDDDAQENNSDEERKMKQKNAVAAFDDTSELDDEVERVLSHRPSESIPFDPTDPYANQEFFVKWRHWSYIHCSWDTRETLFQLAGYKRVKNYIKRMEDLDRKRRILSREEIELLDVERQMEYEISLQHQTVERIVAERQEKTGDRKYLCKWQGLPYGENTWELIADVTQHGGQGAIDEYLQREQRVMSAPTSVDMARRMFLQRHRALQEQPAFLKGGGKLRDYQMQSLNWMIYSWLNNTNIILADEMGLGKTVQCASLLGYFSEVLQIYGPFLVVVPLSTVPNWIREFRKWIPNVNAVVYVGDTKSREVIREFEFVNRRRSDREFKFEALITTYELVLKDSDILSQIRWNFLVVDEAHRLKNNESALYKELQTWVFKNKLLVTGTPLQNSVKELWALLHFLEPNRFPSCEDFEMRYDLKNPESVSQLHADLKPHLLRRVIKDVERSLPPKNERILRVDMTPLQRQYYKWILTRNFKELNKGSKGQVTLLNIISDLKKCCNHPFLFESAEEEYKGRGDESNQIDRLVRTSGKMVLLDKLLRRLKTSGHRVLLFSQMVHMLDIISDYMRLRGWQHQRLDGSTPSQQRHQAMEHFNADGSTDFAFLLSTRAGGLGINLATADTVIIFDSDWNPQNDLQAMSRAHRIGQKSHVNIYRLVTMGSVEQDILERAKRKMVLDHVIIQRMDTSGRTVLEGGKQGKDMFDKGELAAILRFGAENLFQGEQQGEDGEAAPTAEVQQRDQQLYEEDIDAILARAEVVDQRAQEEAEEKKNELLSAFNVATFKNDEDDATFWSRLIPDDQRAKVPERKNRKGSNPGADGEPSARTARRNNAAQNDAKGAGRKARNRPAMEAAPAVTIEITSWPALCDETGKAAESSSAGWEPGEGLTRREANMFLRGMKRYARIDKLDDIASDVGSTMTDAPPEARWGMWFGIENACRDALAAVEAQGLDPKDAQVDFFGNNIKALELSQQLSAMKILSKEVVSLSDPYNMFHLDDEAILPPPKWASANEWTVTDDSMLLLSAQLYGIGHWDNIAADERLGLSAKLQGAVKDGSKVGDKTFPQGSHLETRVLALLKRMERVRNPATTQQRPGRRNKNKAPLAATPRERGDKKGGSRRATKRQRTTKDDSEIMAASCASALETVQAEMKKMRLLARTADLPEARIRTKTRKYLLAIGDKIVSLPREDGLPEPADLWDYVSEFTENVNDGEQLRTLYDKLDTDRAAKEAEGLDDDGADGDDDDPEGDEEGAEPASAAAAVEEYDEGYDPEADDADEPDGDDDEDWAA